MVFTKYLTDKLAEEERKKVEQLKTAIESLSITNYQEADCDVTFQMQFLASNTTIPILLVSETGQPESATNFGPRKDTSRSFMLEKLREFRESGQDSIVVSTPSGKQYLFFEHSFILKLLTYYPFFQLILIGAFIGFGYFAFSAARRAEQNRVWVGMAKETAHQLGTPISGIVAWIEHLQALRPEDPEVQEILSELRNDVRRLELIAERFSKIGAAPALEPANIWEELEKCRAYMQRRAPRKVQFEFPDPQQPPKQVYLNAPLFEWVVENLLRNALDAMDHQGTIRAEVYEDEDYLYIDISDTGKGIPPGKFKTIFQPGYTTKKRGWGLGLSLSRRIIEEYHRGKIFVKKSAPDEGTTFTIQLPKKPLGMG
ncbi:MAG: sensor histidine kinase [Bacteroidetes bacterium]|nr:MAG: sensor histidine kinase [Bacteroidota bacterium]